MKFANVCDCLFLLVGVSLGHLRRVELTLREYVPLFCRSHSASLSVDCSSAFDLNQRAAAAGIVEDVVGNSAALKALGKVIAGVLGPSLAGGILGAATTKTLNNVTR